MQIETLKYIYIVAIGLIISGLSLRFGGEQFVTDLYSKKYNDAPDTSILNLIKYSGAAIYILGWLAMAFYLSSKHKGRKFLTQFILSSIMVSVVWVVIEYKEINFALKPKLPLISVSVLLSMLASLIVLKTSLKDIAFIIVSAFLIVFSEYFILPLQRQYAICDGIGLPLLILGYYILFSVFDDIKGQTGDVVETGIPMVDIKH